MISALIPVCLGLVIQTQPQAAASANDQAVSLQRVFTVGQKSHYKVVATIEESQNGPAMGQVSFIPSTSIVRYDFFTKVLKVEAGNATTRYFRPSIMQTDDNSGDDGPVTQKVVLNDTLELTISPINEVVDFKEISSVKNPKPEEVPTPNNWITSRPFAQESVMQLVGSFYQQIVSLSAFIGSANSGVDLAPQLGLLPVKVGDTWLKTVGYQPQTISGSDSKIVVKRLDITYTYQGKTEFKGKNYLLVTGEINLNTDLEKFLEDQYHISTSETHLKSVPLTLKENLKFYLNPKTLETVYAYVDSTGGMSVNTTVTDSPVLETQIHGSTEMKLVD